MKYLPILALVLPLADVTAQNVFEIFPQRPGLPAHTTSYTRLTLGLLGGELLMEVPDRAGHDFFRGVGHDCTGTCRVTGVVLSLQDLNRVTPESYRVVLRNNVATGPNMGVGGLILASPWAAAPVVPGVGPVTYPPIVVPFPCVAIPCTGGFSVGVEFLATVPGDGLHLGSANYAPLLPATGDYPKAFAPSYAWSDPSGVPPLTNSAGDALHIGVVTCDAPVLNMGNIAPPPRVPALNPSFGVGGMWPEAAPRGDGLTSRIEHAPHAGGFAVLFISSAWTLPFSLASFGGCGDWYIDPLSMIAVSGVLDSAGHVQISLLPPGVRFGLLGASIYCQAITIGPGFVPPFRASNAQKVQF